MSSTIEFANNCVQATAVFAGLVFPTRWPGAPDDNRWPIMLRFMVALLAALALAGCSSSRASRSDQPPVKIQSEMNQLYVGMSEGEALAIMKPVALDYGRITYGGTGSGELWFQVSPSEQFCLDIGQFPEFKVTRIGKLQPKTRWIRDSRGGLSVR